MELTYKDFKIGQIVTCVKVDDFFEQHLTIGKQYKIVDLDFHFHNRLCIRGNRIDLFADINFFVDVLLLRKLKIDKIKDGIKNRQK